MEFLSLAPYTLNVLLQAIKKRWLVAPLAALFLIFSGGAAVGPDCHNVATDSVTSQKIQATSHTSHSHAHAPANVLPSILIEPLVSVGTGLNNQVCLVVGFIVLLLLRFARGAKGRFSRSAIAPLPDSLTRFISRDLSFLKITHLKLGIIRI